MDEDELFPAVPGDLAALSDEEVRQYIDEALEAVQQVGTDPASFVTEEVTASELYERTQATVEAIGAARAELASRAESTEGDEPEGEEGEEGEEETAAKVDIESFAALATLARGEAEEPEGEEEEPEGEGDGAEAEAAVAEPVVAAAPPEVPVEPLPPPSTRRLPRPIARHAPAEAVAPRVSVTASAAGYGRGIGEAISSETELAEMMVAGYRSFGDSIPEGAYEKVPFGRADWSDLYPEERRLSRDERSNDALIAAAVNQEAIKAEMAARRAGKSLTASGGLCAPVTPYYQLQLLAVSERPVRASLPGFNADRGGIRFVPPPTISAVTTGVGIRTAVQDAAGGSSAEKSCQDVSCPGVTEKDVAIIYHCAKYHNLTARSFPEQVANWNNLTLAQHARVAETHLLDGIDAASTQVTAASLGLGATGALFGQILAAVNGMRSRHRMDPEAILRLIMPEWGIDLLVSDVIRSQFQRFDTDEERVTALLRSFDVEPTFTIDGATGKGQVFGAQAAAALLPFPSTLVWYLFPEGSFLYLDGGTLELGLVRDSVLNNTNTYEIFGETFEDVAFVGIESLAVTSTLCDSGTVALPHAVPCPVDYSHSS